MTNPFYKNVVFPGQAKKEEKKLDNKEDLSYSKDTAENPVKFEPDYKAYSIVRLGHKRYVLVTIDLDSKTMTAGPVSETVEYETESRCVSEMNKKLATRAVQFRKEKN